MMSWRPVSISAFVRSITAAMTLPRALRLTGTMRCFFRYQPNSGIQVSSRFRM